MSKSNIEQKTDDLEEAARLEAAAEKLSETARAGVLEEAEALRAKWAPTAGAVALAEVSAGLREEELEEAAKLEAAAAGLRPGSAGRRAVEAEAAMLRAKWPDFEKDLGGQVRRLAAHLLARGVGLGTEYLDAAAATIGTAADRLEELEAKVSAACTARPATCWACGIPQPAAGPGMLNGYLVSAIKTFETDEQFREQVRSGQVQSGQATHPWIPGAVPHRGPGVAASPWALPILTTMIRGDARVLAEVGPKLRAAIAEKGSALPSAPAAGRSAPQLN